MLQLGNPDAFVTFREATKKEPAVRVRLLPVAPWMRRRASRLATAEMGEEKFADLDVVRQRDAGDRYSFELLRLGIVAWEGVGDAAGKPVAVSPPPEVRKATYDAADRPTGTVDAFLAIPEMLEAGDRLYVMPDVLRGQEKNGSSASPNGTGEAGTRAPATAKKSAGKKKAGAATNVRTGATRSGRTPRTSSSS
jgi:hypothetical protein